MAREDRLWGFWGRLKTARSDTLFSRGEHCFAHWQNLNEHPVTHKVCGPGWQHGRMWLHLKRRQWGFSWWTPFAAAEHGKRHWDLTVRIGGDETDFGIGMGLGWVAFWLHCDHLFPRAWKYWDFRRSLGPEAGHNEGLIPLQDARLTGIRWFEGYLWLDFWHDDTGWAPRGKWKGLHWAWNWRNWLLGHQRYETRQLQQERVQLPLPEGLRPATITLTERTWKRPRWPGVLRAIDATITPDVPTPVPGKGENDWDCDDDAIEEMTLRGAASIEEAIGQYVASVLRDRRRHGGSREWQPASVETAH